MRASKFLVNAFFGRRISLSTQFFVDAFLDGEPTAPGVFTGG
jgi:hypothetical protein